MFAVKVREKERTCLENRLSFTQEIKADRLRLMSLNTQSIMHEKLCGGYSTQFLFLIKGLEAFIVEINLVRRFLQLMLNRLLLLVILTLKALFTYFFGRYGFFVLLDFFDFKRDVLWLLQDLQRSCFYFVLTV